MLTEINVNFKICDQLNLADSYSGMAEWPNALVLKTRGPSGSVSSTLTPTAKIKQMYFCGEASDKIFTPT